MTEIEKATEALIHEIDGLGFPREFGLVLAQNLGTEMTIKRMTSYLRSAQPESPEEIADEMFAILTDRDNWRDKKINEFYNRKYNYFLNVGIDPDEEDLED